LADLTLPDAHSGLDAPREGAAHGDACGCAHARARADSAGTALHDAEVRCRDEKLRLTPMRRQVLETLLATHRPLSAYELIEQLGPQNGRMIAPITVYRALDFLLEAGFVHRLESRNAFIACPSSHRPGDVVVFLICDQCGGVDEAVSHELRQALDHVAAAQDFRPKTQFIEVAGACAHCRD
jgi:Fur family transcriptional regulator, zinc uptake regulator